MIKLTWSDINNEQFIETFRKIFQTPMNFELTQKTLLLGKAIKEQQVLRNETFDALLKTYGTPNKEVPGSYDITQERRSEYATELSKLNAHEFSVRIKKLDALKITDFVKLSPQDLMAIEQIIQPFEIPDEPQLELEANH